MIFDQFGHAVSGRKSVLACHLQEECQACGRPFRWVVTQPSVMMLDEKVDLVAGDFNGAAWRRDNSNNISIIEEAFADCALPMPPCPTPLWGPGAVLGKWADVCGFLQPPDSDGQWKVRHYGAFSIPPRSCWYP